jgi:uncharacterized protein YqgC (DUF456 family)
LTKRSQRLGRVLLEKIQKCNIGLIKVAHGKYYVADWADVISILLWTLGVALVAVGLVGIVMPALPGHLLIFAGLVIGAWADGFTRVGFWTLALIGVVALASYGIDFAATALGTRRLGATPRAMTGAVLGTLFGLFFGLPGLIIGPFAGAVIGELTATRDLARASKAGVAAWIGFAIGTAVKVGLAFLMVAIFLAALVF